MPILGIQAKAVSLLAPRCCPAAGPVRQLDLCECERAQGFPSGLGCSKEGWFISGAPASFLDFLLLSLSL